MTLDFLCNVRYLHLNFDVVMWLSSSCDVCEGSDYNSAKEGNHCEEFAKMVEKINNVKSSEFNLQE
jgi:hypothetical protein